MPAGKKKLVEGDNQGYGPSWYDAAFAIHDLRKKSNVPIETVLTTSFAVDGTWGMYFAIREAGSDRIYGACGFGRAYPNGAKTMPAAVVHACIKAERELADCAPNASVETQEGLPF